MKLNLDTYHKKFFSFFINVILFAFFLHNEVYCNKLMLIIFIL
jgi:hypothetical protein